ncbi:hypothetical protein G3I40_20540 [Streptomyces sp. SID14478]|uniref:hypothetical protein n=1 Tax=Streptomyces sp. SID14478 TaxID=2706073 RepID=UPI0013D95C02|nr:hypothetical protein [Streptomyces sp. SID14478]NEB77583.1 hypothetical protein [Streptomyces sp. SID14478]
MNHRIAAALLAAAALALTACTADSGSESKPKQNATPVSPQPSVEMGTAKVSSTPPQIAGLTAKQASVELADATGVTTLGNPADNTTSCSNKAAGKKASTNDCSQLITTDTVSIYEYKTPKAAAHWVDAMKANGDWRQVDRFALAWTARDQKMTSKERRVELVVALKKAIAKQR